MRAFVAVEIPEEARGLLAKVQESFSSNLASGVRWVDPYSTHITLKFLGEVDKIAAPALAHGLGAAIQETRPFNIGTGGLGVFPTTRAPRVIWVGLSGSLGELSRLQVRVEEELELIGFAREKRPFSPHLTLGRVKEGVSREQIAQIGRLVAATQVPANSFSVYGISLIESRVTPKGAQYSTISEHRFQSKT